MDSANSSQTKKERLWRRREQERARRAAETGRRGWQLRLMSIDAPDWRECEQLSMRLMSKDAPDRRECEQLSMRLMSKDAPDWRECEQLSMRLMSKDTPDWRE